MKSLAYGAAVALCGLLIALFVRALPDAVNRAREGRFKVIEASCEVLRPAPQNPTLGTFPVAAPDFTLKDYLGRPVSLSSLRGNVVMVNFWATWCGTCVVEMPSMESLVKHMRNRPFRLLAVSVDEEWPTVRRFFKNGTALDVLLDPARETPKRYGTDKFPETFIIDKEGNIRYYVVSDRDWSNPDITACLDAMTEST